MSKKEFYSGFIAYQGAGQPNYPELEECCPDVLHILLDKIDWPFALQKTFPPYALDYAGHDIEQYDEPREVEEPGELRAKLYYDTVNEPLAIAPFPEPQRALFEDKEMVLFEMIGTGYQVFVRRLPVTELRNEGLPQYVEKPQISEMPVACEGGFAEREAKRSVKKFDENEIAEVRELTGWGGRIEAEELAKKERSIFSL